MISEIATLQDKSSVSTITDAKYGMHAKSVRTDNTDVLTPEMRR